LAGTINTQLPKFYMTSKKPNGKKSVDKKHKKLQKDLKEMEYNWKRALADYQNLEKRVGEDKVNLTFISKKIILIKILPILDSLEKFRETLDNEGLDLIIKNFEQALEDLNTKEVEVSGKEFDPNLMEAIELVKGSKNKVVKVHEKGYLLNGKLLRPAKVDVGLGTTEKEDKCQK